MHARKTLNRTVFYKGQRIFRQGTPGDTAFLIQKGSVEIYIETDEGHEKHIAYLGTNQVFGEMALIDGSPRSASARAAEDTTVVIITQAEFKRRLAEMPAFASGLIKVLIYRLRNMLNEQSGLSRPRRTMPRPRSDDDEYL